MCLAMAEKFLISETKGEDGVGQETSFLLDRTQDHVVWVPWSYWNHPPRHYTYLCHTSDEVRHPVMAQ